MESPLSVIKLFESLTDHGFAFARFIELSSWVAYESVFLDDLLCVC